jgi:two-component system nitrate/nitrite response regulator NarL
MTHTLITTDADVRARWAQAFPTGTIYRTSAAVVGGGRKSDVVWLHVGSDRTVARRLVEECLAQLGDRRIVALSDTPSDEQAIELMERGVAGFCHAYAGPAMLQQVSTVVSNEGLWIGPSLMQRLIRATIPRVERAGGEADDLSSLSKREIEVAQHVGNGASNKEIARSLHITERTVKAHLSAIFQKVGVRDRLQLAIFMRSIAP